jgi:hypothetical protein
VSACSSPAVALLFALVFAKPPYEACPLPIVLVLMAPNGDVTARRSNRVVGTECRELAAGVYDGVSMAGTITAKPYETASVDRADDRFGYCDRPALAA